MYLHRGFTEASGDVFDFLFSEQTLNKTHHSYFSFRLYKVVVFFIYELTASNDEKSNLRKMYFTKLIPL